MSRGRAWLVLAALACLAIAVFLAALSLGSQTLAPRQVLHALFPGGAGLADAAGAADDLSTQIVSQLRLPRALAGFACGALLALAGALLQVLLRNPLADPYVLGVSGGAATLGLLAMLLAWPAWGMQAAAFGGALAAILLVLAIARGALRQGAFDATPRLLLAGVVMAAGWGALIALLLAVAPESRIKGMMFWLAGDLDGASGVGYALLFLLLALALVIPVASRLNALAYGDDNAAALGVNVPALRRRIYLVASLATAVAVVTGGTVGFVGLIVPHLIRISFGNDMRLLLPASALTGGALLMAADLAARTVVAPAQLPVGVMTALLGVPVFIWILLRRA